jgi:hypothetical protein
MLESLCLSQADKHQRRSVHHKFHHLVWGSLSCSMQLKHMRSFNSSFRCSRCEGCVRMLVWSGFQTTEEMKVMSERWSWELCSMSTQVINSGRNICRIREWPYIEHRSFLMLTRFFLNEEFGWNFLLQSNAGYKLCVFPLLLWQSLEVYFLLAFSFESLNLRYVCNSNPMWLQLCFTF